MKTNTFQNIAKVVVRTMVEVIAFVVMAVAMVFVFGEPVEGEIFDSFLGLIVMKAVGVLLGWLSFKALDKCDTFARFEHYFQ